MLTHDITSLQKVFAEEKQRFLQTPTAEQFENFRINWLGKRGKLADLYAQLKNCSPEERPLMGKQLNILKQEIEAAFIQLKEAQERAVTAQRLAQSLDISLPVEPRVGGLHPVTLMREALLKAFRRYGFTVYEGPEIEYEFYNFTALNILENHPARDMQDSFFVANQPNLVLRTHTSNIQIHSMLQEKPPLRIVAPGRVFRVDSDATHTPMFHQLESVVVDRGISFVHLKGLIDSFLKEIFGSDLQTRLRPSYFPFVEPGAEVDLQCSICRGKGCKVCKQTGWLEVGGCGMIHPNVFEAVSYDSEDYTGFAFGFGIDRLAMLAYGLPDLRHLFEGDANLLSQFPAYV